LNEWWTSNLDYNFNSSWWDGPYGNWKVLGRKCHCLFPYAL